MITVSEISKRSGLSARVIQKRIATLKLQVKKVGPVMQLTDSQAEKIEAMSDKPGPKPNGKK